MYLFIILVCIVFSFQHLSIMTPWFKFKEHISQECSVCAYVCVRICSFVCVFWLFCFYALSISIVLSCMFLSWNKFFLKRDGFYFQPNITLMSSWTTKQYTEFYTSSDGSSSSHLLYFKQLCFAWELDKRWVKSSFVSFIWGSAFLEHVTGLCRRKRQVSLASWDVWRSSSDKAEPFCICGDAYGAAAVLSS